MLFKNFGNKLQVTENVIAEKNQNERIVNMPFKRMYLKTQE